MKKKAPSSRQCEAMTWITDLWEDFINQTTQSLADSSIKRIRETFLQFFHVMADNPISTTDREEVVGQLSLVISQWQQSMIDKGNKGSTIKKNRSVVDGFFKWLLKRGEISRHPGALVKPPQQKDTDVHIYTKDEYEKLKQAAVGTPLFYAIICAYRTGMSLADVCLLRWDDVDLGKLMIKRIRHKMRSKVTSHCIIPIHPGSDLFGLLKHLNENKIDQWPGKEFVHPPAAAEYMTGNRINMQWKRMCDKVGIKGKFHDFRHTFISHLANSGMNMALACKVSGHQDPSIFTKYVTPDEDAIRDGVANAFNRSKRSSS